MAGRMILGGTQPFLSILVVRDLFYCVLNQRDVTSASNPQFHGYICLGGVYVSEKGALTGGMILSKQKHRW